MFVSSEMWRPAVCVDRSGAVCLSSIFNGWPLSYPTGKVAGT